MKFTIATLTAVMLSLTTLEVNAMKLNKNMQHKVAMAEDAMPADVALFMDDIEQPQMDEVKDFVTSHKVNTPVLATWDTLVCEAGEFEIAGTCEICPAGYMSFTDSQSCILCPTNYYSAAGSGECTVCPDGFSSVTPAAYCNSNEGASQLAQVKQSEEELLLEHCEAGQYMYADVCYDCWAGTFSTEGATACHECPENFTSDPHAEFCDRCPEGYDTQGMTGQSACAWVDPDAKKNKLAQTSEKSDDDETDAEDMDEGEDSYDQMDEAEEMEDEADAEDMDEGEDSYEYMNLAQEMEAESMDETDAEDMDEGEDSYDNMDEAEEMEAETAIEV